MRSTAHKTKGGLIELGVCTALLPKGCLPHFGTEHPIQDLHLPCVMCDKKSSYGAKGQPVPWASAGWTAFNSAVLKTYVIEDVRYLSLLKKKKRKNRRKKRKKKAIPVFDLFPAVSMDLIQESMAPHRPPQGSSGVLRLPWKPAEEQARSSDLEEALSFKEL